MSSYGYASEVGEWTGVLVIPEVKQRPLDAVSFALSELTPIFETFHRPTELIISWFELDHNDQEISFHELDEFPVRGWADVATCIESLAPDKPFAISCIFLKLDTEIIENRATVRVPASAELQLSIAPPETKPTSVGLSYTLFIDAWLSFTYGEEYAPRDNRSIAAANRPRLADALRHFREKVGSSFNVGRSQLYPFAICDAGFLDIATLPPKTNDEGTSTSS